MFARSCVGVHSMMAYVAMLMLQSTVGSDAGGEAQRNTMLRGTVNESGHPTLPPSSQEDLVSSNSSTPMVLALSGSSYGLAASVYEHAGFKGKSRDVFSDISWVGGDWNDLISSLVVYPHKCIIIYEHAQYGGKHKRYCAENTVYRVSYVGSDWNDKVSSLKVEDHSAPAATIYQHSNFEGKHRDVYGDISNVGREWNDMISSLVVYPHRCVTFYQHENYAGKYKKYCAGNSVYRVSYVGNAMNDQFTSVRVSKNAMRLNSLAVQTPHLEDTGAFSKEGVASSSTNSSSNTNASLTMLASSESSWGLAATVYEHAQYGGSRRDVYGDIPWVGDDWNDLISSFVVYPHKCMTVYQHIHFGGKYKSYCAGSTMYRVSYVGNAMNDEISSIKVEDNSWGMAKAASPSAAILDTGAFIEEGFTTGNLSSARNNTNDTTGSDNLI